MVRLPDGMRDVLARIARDNKRTMNAEIVARLERSFQNEAKQAGGMTFVKTAREMAAKDQNHRIAKLEEMIRALSVPVVAERLQELEERLTKLEEKAAS